MVNYSAASLDATFQALADPTRRAILARLARSAATVGELARPFHMSLPAVSKHLRILERAGLMERKKAGRTHHCMISARPLENATTWLAEYRRYWENQFDALAEHLANSEDKD